MKSEKKTVFLKSDKVGEGELGSMLVAGFLNAFSEQDVLLDSIILVNSAILLATLDENDNMTLLLKNFEQKGVKIYSCGTCLDYYNKKDALKVGIASNAKDITSVLLTNEIITL